MSRPPEDRAENRPSGQRPEGKAAFVEHFAEQGRTIDDFHARVQQAGAPDVANGSAIQSTIDLRSYQTSGAEVWKVPTRS